MADISEFLGGLGGSTGLLGMARLAFYALLVLGVLSLCGIFLWYIIKRKRNWNLKVEIKIVRSDGKLLSAEWAKGEYNIKRGVVWIKRKGKPQVPMKPFDTEKFLQGEKNILTVQQISPGHYIPVLPESFLEMEDDVTGQTASFARVKADFSESKSWKNQFEREAKQAYTIMSLLKEYAPYIGIGIVLFMNFAGFAVLYSRMT